MIRIITRLLKEPILQFFILGAGIFIIFGYLGETQDYNSKKIIVSPGQIERLTEGWKKTWMRPPTVNELKGLIKDHINEEIYYREALSMGLDQDDIIIRRRLRQKMEFLYQDLNAPMNPTNSELQNYLDENTEKFRTDPQITFRHIYFNSDQRGNNTRQDAQKLLDKLKGNDSFAINNSGDTFALPLTYDSVSKTQVANLFGKDFAENLIGLEPNIWQGPVSSSYGLHLVLIKEWKQSEIPKLNQIRDEVEKDYLEKQQQKINDEKTSGICVTLIFTVMPSRRYF